MTRDTPACTLGAVFGTVPRWGVRLLALAGMALALPPAVARAQAPDLSPVGTAPIVRVLVAKGTVNIRTWDRPSVQVDDTSGVTIRRFAVESNQAQSTIPVLAGQVQGPDGPVELPAESFAVSTLSPGQHDVVAVRGSEANVTVTVPQNAALVQVQMGKGNVTVQDYRQGTLVARVRNGSVHLANVGGDGFVQVMRGPVVADNSSFSRVRVRSGTGNVVFNNCRAKQIEVSSVRGSIAYDGGSFEPGLARFETQTGNVALGVNGDAELAAHASPGRVFTSFDSGAQVSGHDGEQHAVLGGGGPVVNASSGSGNVYLYNGQIAARHTGTEWQALRTMMQRPERNVPAEQVTRPAAMVPSRIEDKVPVRPAPASSTKRIAPPRAANVPNTTRPLRRRPPPAPAPRPDRSRRVRPRAANG